MSPSGVQDERPDSGKEVAAEAMGGLRYINGFPGEAPPHAGISLGDSLAGMVAAQGILAALYRRDAVGHGTGQVIDVSLMEACFSLLESAVPEYDLLGAVRGPSGTGLEGVAPSNLFKTRDGKWVVIAAKRSITACSAYRKARWLSSVARGSCESRNLPVDSDRQASAR